MAPDPRNDEENHSLGGGPIISGHKISLNVHYDQQSNVIQNNNTATKLNGNLTPIEQKVASTGALHLSFQERDKVTHVDNVVVKSVLPSEETEQESLQSSSLHSNYSFSDVRPSTPETTSAHSDEKIESVIARSESLIAPVVAEARDATKEYLDGPDQIIPTDDLTTWKPNGCTRIKFGDETISARKPISVPSLMYNVSHQYPNRKALTVKREGKWQSHTYAEYYASVRTMAKAFIKLGLDRYHGVCILGFNSPEWFISDLAAIFAGGFAAGIYTTNSPEACELCGINCKAQIWVVEDQKQLNKVLSIKDKLPYLKTIIQYSGIPAVDGVLSWEEAMNIGKKENDDALEDRLRRIAINECCTLIYTSGTTGAPKGVMLNHDNLTWTAYANLLNIDAGIACEVFVSYLPLSHVAAQMTDLYPAISAVATVVFAQPDALKGTLVQTLKEAKPTRFLGVPRVWEKMYERMNEVGKKTTGIKKTIATWAKAIGTETNRRRELQIFTKPSGYSIANAIVFKNVKAALGLEKCLGFLSGAAPISPEILHYFHSLDICLTDIYGMSESTGPHTCCLSNSFKVGSVGRTVPGCYTKIDSPDKDGNGEIFMGGRNVCMGYLQMEDKTHESIDCEGWLHTGDIGKLDNDGYLFITGRIKEIIITAGGENIPPILIEDNVKSELPCISNTMLIGDKRKFLSMILTFKTNMDDEGEPLDSLAPASIDWCRSIGSAAATIQDVLAPDINVMRAIQNGIDRANSKASSNAQKIQKWSILPRDFTVSGDEIGPTLKLKRPTVNKKYYDTIEQFYA